MRKLNNKISCTYRARIVTKKDMDTRTNALNKSILPEKTAQLMISVHIGTTIIIFQYSALVVVNIDASVGLIKMQFGDNLLTIRIKDTKELRENFYGELATAIRQWLVASIYDSDDLEVTIEKIEKEGF